MRVDDRDDAICLCRLADGADDSTEEDIADEDRLFDGKDKE